MQQQVYGKTLTPAAESVSTQVQQANQLTDIVQVVISIILAVSVVMSLIFFALANAIKKRSLRIEQRLN